MESQSFNFYDERKFCPSCEKYVHFLQNIHHSYCVDCGSVVHLMSQKEFEQMNAELQARKPVSRRSPRRKTS